MLSAARRSLFAASSSTATVVDRHHRLATSLVSLCAQRAQEQSFSTTSTAAYPLRPRISKEKWTERREKLEKRRTVRETRRVRQAHKEFVHAEVAMKRRQEVEQKKEVGEVRTALSPSRGRDSSADLAFSSGWPGNRADGRTTEPRGARSRLQGSHARAARRPRPAPHRTVQHSRPA